ncbi:efflux RND transporter periplasmic adaptor subunit [Alteriqipengyuania lutimaris]|uniref:Efflux RND transporter periplasmic adaptor subunit n=1 Tax=Alteriqipengyuania lutimaris TaxID=1538146 RepID=A0A395LJZ2_9SPHN|nr:efflux RND transporter periplasmic adaptor subunit [Alteriqipengyuania lutimaris]MBB3033722.1 HlyD family secretion protein [Alteriqipengyuania lutimaris]RDS77293.1 efflux RND transporter periplasmic adaptor subunit [Alteriqipengyuania lutimaris]
MNATDTAATEDRPENVDEFLGEKPRPRWRRWMKFWLPAVIILALVLLVATCSGGDEGPGYITEEVERGSLDLTVTATGNLRPTNQVTVGSEVNGPVERVLVDVNDRVTRGQVIAVINTEIIDQQIAQARANLNAARASLTQARATLDVDTAQLQRLEEVRRLSDGRVPSQVELEQAQAAVSRDRAALASARANIEAAQASLQANLTTRSRAVIRAPVTGVVLARQIEPGQTVVASFNTVTLFVIAEDLSAMQLRVSIDEADVGAVDAGQRASFTVDAYPGRRFPATVERVDLASGNTVENQGAAAAGASVVSYEARLAVDNPEGLLRPGMTATATIATDATGQVMLVPNAALRFRADQQQEGGGGVFNPQIGLEEQEQQSGIGAGSRQQVQVLQDDGTLRAIEVVTGQSDGRRTAVRSADLKPGMKVVTGVQAQGE